MRSSPKSDVDLALHDTEPAPSGQQSPCLFVTGCPRSGTTLLQRMLDHHRQLAVAKDTHFIPRCLEVAVPEAISQIIHGQDLTLTPQLVDAVKCYHRFPRLGLSDSAIEQAAVESRTYREFVGALYSEYARLHGKPLAGEKIPDYVRHIRLLNALFPAAKMIHIIRDGRDVALSVREWAGESKGPGKFELWREEPIAVCALWWRWLVSSGRAAGKRLAPTHYVEVAYEDLVACPDERLRELAAFLDLPFAPQMLAYHEGKKPAQTQNFRRKAHGSLLPWGFAIGGPRWQDETSNCSRRWLATCLAN